METGLVLRFDMEYKVTKNILLDRVTKSIDSDEEFKKFRSFVYDYYYAEDTYLFEPEELLDVFAELSSYFEYEETYGDPNRNTRLIRIKRVFEKGYWTREHIIFARELDELNRLNNKLEKGVISAPTYKEQVRKLSPMKFDVDKVIQLYKMKLLE